MRPPAAHRTYDSIKLCPLPNQGSPHQTLASRYIDLHYAQLALVHRWTWDHFVRFCRFTQFTPYESASLVQLPHSQVERFQRNNRLTGPVARLVAFNLTMAEGQLMKNVRDDLVTDLFPDLSKI